MILVASQRGGAKELALHLLNSKENDHVTIYELSGFVADDLTGALREIQAVAKGTKCKQPFVVAPKKPDIRCSLKSLCGTRAATSFLKPDAGDARCSR